MCSLLLPVPRLLFEDWTYDDFQNVLDSEDEIEELGKTVVQVAKVRPVHSSGPVSAHKAWSPATRPHFSNRLYLPLPTLLLICFPL